MSKGKKNPGSGLAITGLILIITALLVMFYFNQCIFGIVIAILGAILSTTAFIEARRTDGPVSLTLSILLITWLGAIFTIYWTASGPQTGNVEGNQLETVETTNQRENMNKEKRLREMEEQIEKLEDEDKEN